MSEHCPDCGKELIKNDEVAAMIGVHRKSVPRMRRGDGSFPEPHITSSPLWDPDEIRAWMEANGRL